MGRKAFKRVNQFSLTKMLKDIDNLYEGLIFLIKRKETERCSF